METTSKVWTSEVTAAPMEKFWRCTLVILCIAAVGAGLYAWNAVRIETQARITAEKKRADDEIAEKIASLQSECDRLSEENQQLRVLTNRQRAENERQSEILEVQKRVERQQERNFEIPVADGEAVKPPAPPDNDVAPAVALPQKRRADSTLSKPIANKPALKKGQNIKSKAEIAAEAEIAADKEEKGQAKASLMMWRIMNNPARRTLFTQLNQLEQIQVRLLIGKIAKENTTITPGQFLNLPPESQRLISDFAPEMIKR